MATTEELEQDIIELQIAYTHQEEHIQTLDSVVIALQKEIEALKAQIEYLQEQVNNPASPEQDVFTLVDEKPPHY